MMEYVLIYSDSWGEREDIAKQLSDCDMITHWRYDLPNAFYLVSDDSANDIAKYLMDKFPKKRFVVAEINAGNIQGWLPKDTWTFFKKHKDD